MEVPFPSELAHSEIACLAVLSCLTCPLDQQSSEWSYKCHLTACLGMLSRLQQVGGDQLKLCMAAAQHAAKKELPQHTVKNGLSWQILVVIAIASALLVLGGLLGFHYLSRCSTVDCVEARSAASHITFHSNSSNGDCSSALQIPQVSDRLLSNFCDYSLLQNLLSFTSSL